MRPKEQLAKIRREIEEENAIKDSVTRRQRRREVDKQDRDETRIVMEARMHHLCVSDYLELQGM